MIDLPGHSRQLSDLPVFTSQPWQMSYGERTVIEGALSMLKPRLAIEIGRAEGGSLRRIAAHSDEVLSFDLVEAPEELVGLENVTALSGDSHAQLPIELKRIADEDRNVDFVLVDGDHSADGVRRDVQDLLDSDAIVNTVILIHDTLNEEVRQGLTLVDYDAYEKLVWIDLDFVPGYVARLPERLGECWGGLGLMVVNADGAFRSDRQRHQEDLFDQPSLVWPVAQWVRREGKDPAAISAGQLILDRELQQTQEQLSSVAADLERHRAWLDGIQGSASWRITSPLRALKRRLRERRSSSQRL